MTENEAAEAVIAWAQATVPELSVVKDREATWPPSVGCAIRRTAVVPGPVEQTVEFRREVDLLVAVQPEPHDAAESSLYGFMQTLMDELIADTTLGGRARVYVSRSDDVCSVGYGQAEDLDGGGTADAAVMSFTLRDPR